METVFTYIVWQLSTDPPALLFVPPNMFIPVVFILTFLGAKILHPPNIETAFITIFNQINKLF